MLFPIQQLKPAEFPSLLGQIPDPPKVLYVRGTLPTQATSMLCVVGSRKSSVYGREVCSMLISGLRGYDIAIVSGLAIGTDAHAHEAALKAGLTTIAIPGSGLGEQVLYPRTNYALAERIIKEGGALLSEFPENYKARPESFPQRNRIMAGMSHAVLIIEGELRSGTMITARLALEYNREVLAVPGSILSTSSTGSNQLIQDGAVPIQKSEDILEVLGIHPQEEKAHIAELSEEERSIVAILKEPKTKDTLLEELGMPAHQANILISELELKGIIREKMGSLEIV